MNPKLSLWLLTAILLVLPHRGLAQQPKKIPRVGYLAFAGTVTTYRTDAFRQGLRQLGYAEGKDFVIEDRNADGKLDRLNELAAELVRLKVDVICHAWSGGDTRREGGNYHDPHCHDRGH